MPKRYLVPLAVAATLVGGLTPPAQSATPRWRADLSTVDSDDVGVAPAGGALRLDATAPKPAGTRAAQRSGFLLLAPHELAEPANAVAARVSGSVPEGAELAVDVRGALADGQWSEWVEARPERPAVLPEATRTVQVRVVLTALGAGPELRALTLRALTLRALDQPDQAESSAAGRSYRVYATREGLVGGTTANGHVITSRDHFVALPSRRGLSTKGTGTYSVRVCASNGRCAWAPVWDVGPWNTRDDHWNPATTREMWQDLPQGKPQAQAAYEDDHNRGEDQFGRSVANPAGIDLADGTFWDGLGLTDNAWVTVTYQWTGSGPTGYVRTAGGPLTVHDGASSAAAQVGLAANHAQVRVECLLTGQSATGTRGTSTTWYRIAAGKYVAGAHVAGVTGAPPC